MSSIETTALQIFSKYLLRSISVQPHQLANEQLEVEVFPQTSSNLSRLSTASALNNSSSQDAKSASVKEMLRLRGAIALDKR